MDEVPLEFKKLNIMESENVKNLDTVNPATVDPILTDELIDKMKVAELRVELEKRGISKNGLKDLFFFVDFYGDSAF